MKKTKKAKTLLSLLLASPMVLGLGTLAVASSTTANAKPTADTPVFMKRNDYDKSQCFNGDELTGKVMFSDAEYYESLKNNTETITNVSLEDRNKEIYYGSTYNPINGVMLEAYYNAKTDTFYDVKARIKSRSCVAFNAYDSLPAVDQFGNKYKVELLSRNYRDMYRLSDGKLSGDESFIEDLSVELSDKALKKYAKTGINLTLRSSAKDPIVKNEQPVIIPPYLLQITLQDFRGTAENLKYYK